MKIDGKVRYGKLQNDINKEAAKISALSSDKIDKYKYLTGEGILPSNQRRVIEQAKVKVFEKQIETIEDQGEKQIKTLEEPKKQLVKFNALAEK